MAKGIIYITTTIVDGLIKIGKCGSDQFESRMYHLEHNGYCNVTGLKRKFAIEVEDYDEKENLLHTIFGKSKIGDTELFATDVNIAMQLLSSFDGKKIFPKEETMDDIFHQAVESSESKLIPDGEYSFVRRVRENNVTSNAKVKIVKSNWTLLKGSLINPDMDSDLPSGVSAARASLKLDDNCVVLEDYDLGFCTPSFAGCVVLGKRCNGWTYWKTKANQPIDIYRTKESEE